MSDDLTQDVDPQSGDDDATPPPWGDDFNPERAWQTITHLRGFEGDAKQFRKFSEDPEALMEFIRERHPNMVAEEPDPDPEPEYEPEPGDDPRIQQLLAQNQQLTEWQAQVERDRAFNRFNEDLSNVAGEREISPQAREWIFHKTVETGDNKQALAKAAQAWFEFEDSLRAPAEPVSKPRVPTPPAAGKTATGTKPFSEMTRQERDDYAYERFQSS